jgi:hypothetical protein
MTAVYVRDVLLLELRAISFDEQFFDSSQQVIDPREMDERLVYSLLKSPSLVCRTRLKAYLRPLTYHEY